MNADIRFIEKLKEGDKDTIDAFVHQYYPAVLNYCRYHTWNTAFAEDLTQDVFFNFFQSISSYRHEGKLLHYLYVIARNLCMSRYRGDSSVRNIEEESVQNLISGKGEGDVEGVSQRLDVEQAVRKLSHELREVVILYYFQGLKQREIAKLCGIGLPLVKYRLKQAKKKLRILLGEEE